jgi:thiamine pyridinylase
MKLHARLLLLISLFVSLTSLAQTARRQLTVSLYPYVPNADNLYRKVEKEFEKQNPQIDLIINLSSDYYDEQAGIITEQADVYEIDCILLKDFIEKQKIQPLSNPKTFFQHSDLMPAANVVYHNKALYALPHWLCGNFLMYRSNDSLITAVR